MSENQDSKTVLTKESLGWLWNKIKSALSGKVDKINGKVLSSNDYTNEEKTKLAGIAEGATCDTVMTGATSTSDGTSGLVPAPTSGDRKKFLSGSATWDDVFDENNVAIIEDTDIATHTIPTGFYVLWKGVLYTASSDITPGTTLSSYNLSLVTDGGFNSLNNRILSKIPDTAIKNDLTTVDSGYVLDARQGKALSDSVSTKIETSAIKNDLLTTNEGYVLDARQGKALGDRCTTLEGRFYIMIESNTDLDNLTTSGIYGCPNATTAATLSNNPAGNINFSMIVMNKGSGTYVQAIFVGSVIYTRTKTSTAWNSWYKFTGTTV